MLCTLLFSLGAGLAPSDADLVAVQAGTIHAVDAGRIITGGGTVILKNGKILAVGQALEIPAGARIVDYGPDAVIVPGFVAADSSFGGRSASERTASPTLAAIDEFDLWGNYASTLKGGVTSVYISPASSRLIAGQGAVVKLGGEPGVGRILASAASIEGSISADARRTPGYWEPPIPATVDVGMGVEAPQLPRTTMGAMIALGELLELAAEPVPSEEYGPYTGDSLAELIGAGVPWRMRAETANEISAMIGFAGNHDLPLVLRGASAGGPLAVSIADSGAAVIVYSVPRPNSSLRDAGKGRDDTWPDMELAAKLAAAGVRVAIAPPANSTTRALRFHASLARSNGLGAAGALASVTLDAARILGVDDRVGSLTAGKDGDLVVLNGAPMDATSSVLATWVDGEVVWKASERGAVVLEVDELFIGDGQVLEPGQLLMDGGKIVEVGRRVSHPKGCTVVRGAAAMPGMIDTYGHLGLEGSTKTPRGNYKYKRMIEAGDFADRRVAQAGVTCVVMTPRGAGGSGMPAVAYKPAGVDLDTMIVADPAIMHLVWSNSDRLKAGAGVVSVLEKASEYKKGWDEYEAAILDWVAPPLEPEEEAKEDEDEEEDEDTDENKDDDDKKKKKKKKKRKKKGEDDDPPFPVTGIWLDQVETLEGGASRLRFQLLETDGAIEGFLRCDELSAQLIELKGERVKKEVTLKGLGLRGAVVFSAKTKEKKLTGTVVLADLTLEFTAERTSIEYPLAARSERRKPDAEEKQKDPKGKPKMPQRKDELEPFKAAMEGRASVVVRVERDDEILACVQAFEDHGIKPILFGANDAWKVSEKIVGRVAGVLLDHRVIYSDSHMGTAQRNRYAELAGAGLAVAFHSSAEEGAADLALIAAYAVSQGMSPEGALHALTLGAARMFHIDDRVGSLRAGLDADVLLLKSARIDSLVGVERVWVNGREVRLHP